MKQRNDHLCPQRFSASVRSPRSSLAPDCVWSWPSWSPPESCPDSSPESQTEHQHLFLTINHHFTHRENWLHCLLKSLKAVFLPSPGCSYTCSRSPRPGWPWWCSSRPPAGCTTAATESSSSTQPTPSVCVSARPTTGWRRRRRRRRRCWSRRLNQSSSPSRTCPETTETYIPRTERLSEGEVGGRGWKMKPILKK